MNPLASYKCAQRLLVSLTVVSSILLMAACGSSNSGPPINQVGFTNGSLTGTYVFSSQGVDSNGFFLTVAGALVADGNGGIKGGTMDVVGVNFSPSSLPITGSYSVGSDGRSRASLNSSAGTITIAFVLTSTSHGLVIQFDGNGTGSGTIDLQTAVPTLTQLAAGPYAFSLSGIDTSDNSLATTGSFTLNSSGNSTAGVQDFNDAGIPYLAQLLTTTATVGSGTNPGTITLNGTLGGLTFDYYPIDASHLKLIETDYTFAILSGDVFARASIPSGPMVFTMTGGTTGPVAVGGLMTSDGTGNFPTGSEDVNDNGVVSQAPVSFSGTLDSALSGPTGRVVVDLSGFIPATRWVIYPSTGGLLMLEADSITATLGNAYAQTSTSLPASQNYGFNLSAVDLGNGSPFEEDDLAQFLTSSTGFTGTVDINDEGGTTPSQSFVGTFPAPADSTGRGTATTTAANNTFVSFTYYVVNASTVLLLETDTIQTGAGTFELQNSSGAGPVGQSRISLIRPSARSHGAFHHK